MTSGTLPRDDARQWVTDQFLAHADAAFNVAYRIVWNRADAQDVVQSTFLKAAVRREQLHDPGKARGWLLSIAYREALMVLRRRRDVPTDPAQLPDRPATTPDPADATVTGELAGMLAAAIEELPVTLRIAFVLRDVEELPVAEVAEVLGIGVSAAKMRVSRAREQLRLALSDWLQPE